MEEILRLIVIDDSSNDAEVVTNALRNAGHAVRTERVEDDEDLREALSQHDWDMVLTKPELPFLHAADALHILSQMELDLPLMILGCADEDPKNIELLKSGARGVVCLQQPNYLIHTLIREWQDLCKRRRHKECETQLHEANRRAQTLVDSSRDAIAYVHEGMHIYANHSYLQLFGYSDFAELEGMPIMNMVTKDDHGKFKEYLRGFLKRKGKEADTLEINGLRADGKDFSIEMEFSPASYEGESCIQIIIRDQSASKELEAKLDHLSKQDMLTGLYNRQVFLEKLEQLAGKPGKTGAILHIKPDNIKGLRDEIGVAGIDKLLAAFANLLKATFDEKTALLARMETHLFTGILYSLNEEQAQAAADKLLKAVEEAIFDISGHTPMVTCSVGVTLYSPEFKEAQEILARAEKAYNKAVESEGNSSFLYNPLTEEMAERAHLESWARQIKMALKEGQFKILYQPIVSLHGDSYENYELLLRMQDENGELLTPDKFIPMAEKVNLMSAIDRWVILHSVKTQVERHRAGKKTNFFVKLSAATIKDPQFLAWLRDLLQKAKVDASHIIIEVSEEVASTNLKSVKVLTEGLSQLRMHLALDHFGTAANYQNILKHCNAKYLKISGEIIKNLASDESHQQKVQEITAHAQENNQVTIAEFVEDANTLASLWSCGIDYIQGYFLQEPDAEMSYDFSAEH